MKKTINVNLNGRVFTIDEDAYQLLDNYLNNLRIYFRKEEGSSEIIADFEARIEELLSEKVRQGYQVINISQVEEVIARVGKPTDFSEENSVEDEKQTAFHEYGETKKRFFRNPEDKIIGGVCSGLSVYFEWEVLPVRIIMFILIFATSLWIIPVYLLAWMLFPEAKTAAQKLQMRGKPINVENIGKTVAAQVERLERNENHGFVGGFIRFIGSFLKICFIVLACIIAFPVLFAIVLTIIILFAVLFGVTIPLSFAFLTVSHPILATVTFILLLLIPLMALIYGIISHLAKLKPLNMGIKWACFCVWIFALILFFSSGFKINFNKIDNFNHWSWGELSERSIKGNGTITEKEYFLQPMETISIEQNLIAQLRIEQTDGDSVFVKIRGSENLIDKIGYQLENNCLRLYTLDNSRLQSDNDLTIFIQTPSLKQIKTQTVSNISIDKHFKSEELDIKMEGVGKMTAEDLEVQSLKVVLDGVGLIELAGTARSADLKMHGAGKINAWELLTDTVDAYVDGVGLIQCNPTDYVDGKINGLGKIQYKKEPKSKNWHVFGIAKIKEKL